MESKNLGGPRPRVYPYPLRCFRSFSRKRPIACTVRGLRKKSNTRSDFDFHTLTHSKLNPLLISLELRRTRFPQILLQNLFESSLRTENILDGIACGSVPARMICDDMRFRADLLARIRHGNSESATAHHRKIDDVIAYIRHFIRRNSLGCENLVQRQQLILLS